ncbi:MAG: SUMF1/EgtB/PvdO family nonheme iron enzyme [Deltaproteobacteria bacterium]|nr:SUMF1/EgtB/PvdO family nonheme iron enzyme [Deltaproteobacteria bacterium]
MGGGADSGPAYGRENDAPVEVLGVHAPRSVPPTADLPTEDAPLQDPAASDPVLRADRQRALAVRDAPRAAPSPRSTMALTAADEHPSDLLRALAERREATRRRAAGLAGLAGPAGEVPPVAGRYHDRGLIACGAMGEVRQVWDGLLHTHHAIKVMLPQLARRPQARARFLREIRVTASLNHPGIVSVIDRGELDDRRLWYVMDEVRGETLGHIMHQVRLTKAGRPPDATAGSTRRLIAAFEQLCQAVASAHQVGVVHRDLKPDNVMIGRFGEVRVMDWGLALARGEDDPAAVGPLLDRSPTDSRSTQAGHVLGTPMYMAPEQAAGALDQIGPHSDVYALGVILFELIAGEPPWADAPTADDRQAEPSALDRSADAPRELCAIASRAMRVDPAGRYPSAAALAEDVAAWLDGARRRAEALELVAAAARAQPEVRAAAEAARRRLGAARDALQALPEGAPVEDKAPLWRDEDEALRQRRESRLRDIELMQGARAALNLVPDLPEGHRLLAQHYADRLIEAEREGRLDEAAEAEELLKVHDRGQHAALLRGDGRVDLRSAPAGAEVRALRFVELGRRLVLVDDGVIGNTPLRGHELPRGSYLLELRAPGHTPARVGVRLGRLEEERMQPPGGPPLTVRLLPAGAVGPEVVHVPGGWFWSGGDPLAVDALPARRLWVDSLLVQRFPVQVSAWAAWVREVWAAGGDAAELVPAGPDGAWAPDAAGCPCPRPELLRLPLSGAPLRHFHAYAGWLAAQTGVPWRLPHDQEWEKAARGVDGRHYPWGDHFDASWAVSGLSGGSAPRALEVDAQLADVGPFGVVGAAGNLRELCRNRYRRAGPPPDSRVDPFEDDATDADVHVVVRGGSFTSMAFHCRLAGRFVSRPVQGSGVLTARLVASIPDGAA